VRPAIDYRYFTDPDGADQDGFVGPVRHSCICALTDGGVRGPLPPSGRVLF
jgi:hypothetical protein